MNSNQFNINGNYIIKKSYQMVIRIRKSKERQCNGQTMIYKTLQRKLKIEQHESH